MSLKELEVPFLRSMPHTFTKNPASIEAPFLVPSSNVRQGLIIPYGVYGSPDEEPKEPTPSVDDDFDLAAIEEYAPTAARLIKGLSPEESIALLQSRISNLEPYKNTPVVGFWVKNKINEYELRLEALKRQARIEQFKSLLTLATWGTALVGATGFALFMFRKYKQTKGE